MDFGKITSQSRSAETHFVNLVLNDWDIHCWTKLVQNALKLRTVWCRDKSKTCMPSLIRVSEWTWVKRPINNEVIRRRDLCLHSHPTDRRSGGSILRSLDWQSSVLSTTLPPLPAWSEKYILERIVNNQKTAQKSVKRYFGGMVSWEKIPFVTCVQQISESDCTAY